MSDSLPDTAPALPAARAPRRVLLLGGNGLLGGAFRRAWARHPRFVLREFSRAELNLSQPHRVEQALESEDFDLLVNAAAYTKVDDAEVQPDLAMAVNALAPGRLAEHCALRGARMVHFSTDYVFDGMRGTPLTENDAPNPLSTYGRSKLLGEELVAAASSRHVIARLAWLFGQGRDAFPEWLLHKALREEEVRVVSDKTGSPTWNGDIPGWIEALLAAEEGGAADSTPQPEVLEKTARIQPAREEFPGGLIHLSHGPACSWLDYAQGVLDAALTLGWPLRTLRASPVSLESLPGFTARRPRQSALDTGKFTRVTGLIPRDWREAMALHLASKALPG